MKIIWDKQKRVENFRKHGIDFQYVYQAFVSPVVTMEDSRFDYPEPRYWLFGFIKHIPVLIVYTYVSDDAIRVISCRKATKYEQSRYFSTL